METNGIRWCKVAHGDPDITRVWGEVQSGERCAYSLAIAGAHTALVMGTRELPVMTVSPS